ncbi:retrovirus-related pol polyprotein from transposon TNT 1-94, partial [Tanacetum coccineum]
MITSELSWVMKINDMMQTYFVHDINGADLLKGSRSTNLYTILIDDMMKSSPICLLSKASKSKSWLWHRRLNHLNFGTINDLARKDLVRGLPRLKFEKDHLCSACQLGKSKKFSHKPKSKNTNMEVLHTLHMDLCGPMRVQSIKGKKYILVIVDDYSRFTWVKFLRSKDETPEFVINFLKQIQVGLNKTVRYIRTDNGTEFVNQVMSEYYEGVGVFHQKSVPRTPQQNGVVERRNHTLVEAARTMMIFSKAPMFLWAEAVATACYHPKMTLIHTRHRETLNDSEDLGKFQAKADIRIFVGYAPNRKGYRIYNKRTRQLMVTIVIFAGDTSDNGSVAQDAPLQSASLSTSDMHHPIPHQGIAEEPTLKDAPIHQMESNQDGIMRDVKNSEEVRREVLSVLEIDWLAGHKKAKKRCNITNRALSIENRSLFEGESEFEKLKIYLITLVSIRSDWEDLCGVLGVLKKLNTMAEQNVPAQPPTRTDEQIVPRSQWLIIGKSNLLFNAQKIQKNPIFQISVDILSNTNFFQAFTASANVPAIYLQQFWNTMKYNEKTGVYSCQVDEQWFDLSADLLRKALAITPVNPAHPFELPPSGNTVIDFVNELGYPEPVEIVSNIRVNYVYQPWRAILTLINQCLTGKTSGSDKPRHPVLQMLWGIVTQTNVDHAELLWEEFTQGIQTFFSHKASHKASLKDPKKKVTPLLIPYGRFSKVIIYYLASNNNIHRRPDSAVHHTGDDFILGNLKFVPKGETVEVFGMAIPDPLITEAIQQSSYYPKYLEMVAKNTKKTPQESASEQPATKRAPPKKPTTTTPVKPSKPAPALTKKPSKHKLPHKVRKGKPTFQLVDEDDEAQQESVPQEEGDDPDLELAKKMSLDAHQEKGEGEGADADIERAIKLSLDPAFLPQGRAPVGGVTIRDPVSETTPKLPEVVGKGKAIVTEEQVAHSLIDLSKKKRTTDQFILNEQKELGEVDSSTVSSGVSIPVSTQGQSGSDPEKSHEALAGPDPEPMKEDQTGSDSGKLHVSLAGPNPEHMDDEFLAIAYPKVHENLKLITDERVI